MKRLQIKTFGGLRFTVDSNHEVRLPTRKAASLAAYLALHPGKHFTREALADLFWGDKDETRARHSLSQAILHVRRILGEQRIGVEGEAIWMAPANLHVDAVALLDLLKQPQTGLPENLSDFEAGEFLERGEIGQETFDEWLQVERARVRRDVQLSLAEALAHFHAHRDTGNKLRAARTMVSIDPFDEGAHRSIMQALVAEGRAGLAQEHYEEFKRRLSDELGVSPESQTRELYRSICANRSVAREVSTSLSEFAFILEQLPYPVIVTDTASRIVGWNSSSESAFGKLKTEVFGSVPSAVFGEAKPRDRQRDSDEVFQHAVSKGSWSGRAKVRSSDGSVSFVRRLVSPLYSADGELIGAVGQSIHEAIA